MNVKTITTKNIKFSNGLLEGVLTSDNEYT